jgi:hypothetical protein
MTKKFKTALQSESAVPGSERTVWQSSVYLGRAARRLAEITDRLSQLNGV